MFNYIGFYYFFLGIIFLFLPLVFIEIGRPRDLIKSGLYFFVGVILITKYDMKDKLLLEISKKDKCYKIMERLFDILDRHNINIKSDENEIIMMRDKRIGMIKKMKDKVVVSIDNINITFKGNENSDYEFLELLLKKSI